MTTTLTPAMPAIDPALIEAIEEHVFSDTSREVGGVLVGRLETDRAVIKAHIPALRASSDVAHLTFTHDTWSQILDTVDRDYADQQIVGWYHSHPGHGVFLSGYDLFIQRSFFSEPRMTALVIDPLAGDLGYFGWAGDDIVELQRVDTSRAATDRADNTTAGPVTRGAAPRRHLARTGAAAVVVGLLSATAGYAAASLLSPVGDQLVQATGTVAALQDQIAELQAAAGGRELPSDTEEGTQGTDAIIVVVQPGDSWWSLAERFYGDGLRYPEISGANPSVTGLSPGQRVVVPGTQPAE